MNDDYLWDRSGEPDPDVAGLENALGTLAWSGRRRRGGVRAWPRGARPWRMAIAALLVISAGAVIFVHFVLNSRTVTSWQLSLSGRNFQAMRAGELVETRSDARAIIRCSYVGTVNIEPESRLRLIASNDREQRFALDRGTIHALIWAPPARFVVDTPAAKAVDLGCKYTLHVDASGNGILKVEMGWVAFQSHGTESFIPAGAACRTNRGKGPDTPYFMDSSPVFQNALAEFDSDGAGPALHTLLGAARERDGLTLWHLLERTRGTEREEVFYRFVSIVRTPPAVSRDAILRGDKRAMDAAWNALDLGSTNWWREWKREW
jgi:FecR protein